MPFSLHTHPISWNLLKTHPRTKQSIPSYQNLIFRRVQVFSSLRTSLDCVSSDGGVEGGLQPIRLPFVVRSSTKVSRFFWNGSCLELVTVGGGSVDEDNDDGLFRVFGCIVRDFFIPRDVSENYMDYVKWKLLHRVFSSALQVLATQAMFTAIGVGYSSSLPSAAALNWVLKDGLGRLSRCIYTASLASAFDTNLKRVRFATSVLFVGSIGLELLTPTFPKLFLLLATIANIAKQISLACYLATRSAVHQSFAKADNLGEISAKAQIQTVCFDILGLMLAALVNMWIGNHQRPQAGLHLFVYPFFASMDLFGIYQGLKHVHLQTLTKDRLEIILNTWIEFGYVPSPAEVSEKEVINFVGVKGKSVWPIRIGCINPKDQIPKWSIETIRSITDEDYYFVCMEIFKGLKRTPQHRILLSIREGAEAAHIIMGLLQACYIRRTLLANRSKSEIIIRDNNASNSTLEDWFVIVEDGRRSAERDLTNLIEQMVGMGWVVKNILLSKQEQARYSFVRARLLNLEVLDVHSNRLRSLPNSIGCLSKLQVLNVSGNFIESLPSTIENCRDLEELNVNFNNLSKLPDTIGFELIKLVKLSVNSNKLVFLPSSTSHLTALRVLDVRLNCLRSLPDDLENLINLETLNVSQNFQYLETLPYSIGLLLSLVELDVSYNNIKTLPDSIGCLQKLQKLSVEGNPLISPPVEVVEQGLHVVKEYMCDKMNSSHHIPTKKRWWMVKCGTFNGHMKSGKRPEHKGFSMLQYQPMNGLASPGFMGRFSPLRLFSPRHSIG